jgi:hypothetical protein
MDWHLKLRLKPKVKLPIQVFYLHTKQVESNKVKVTLEATRERIVSFEVPVT